MKLAKVRHRIVSSIFDQLIISALTLVLFITVWPGIIVSIVTLEPLTMWMVLRFIRMAIVYTFIVLLYYMVVPIYIKGQTFSKKFLKIKIVNDDGSDVDYKVLFFREAICRILLRSVSFGLSDLISCIIMIIRDDNKNLSDVFAKTKVIDLKEDD
ncbi:MAG: RDD family protein [Bacilli bacterium]|nr:RDD family protein [Bacilli bacterium]